MFRRKGRKKAGGRTGERAWRRKSTRAALNSAPRRVRRATTPFLNERVSIKSIIRARASTGAKASLSITYGFISRALYRVCGPREGTITRERGGRRRRKLSVDREIIGGYYPSGRNIQGFRDARIRAESGDSGRSGIRVRETRRFPERLDEMQIWQNSSPKSVPVAG